MPTCQLRSLSPVNINTIYLSCSATHWNARTSGTTSDLWLRSKICVYFWAPQRRASRCAGRWAKMCPTVRRCSTTASSRRASRRAPRFVRSFTHSTIDLRLIFVFYFRSFLSPEIFDSKIDLLSKNSSGKIKLFQKFTNNKLVEIVKKLF